MLNNLITSLSKQDSEQLFPLLEPVDLPKAFIMAEPYSYFPETGIGAINAVSGASKATVGLFGAGEKRLSSTRPWPLSVGVSRGSLRLRDKPGTNEMEAFEIKLTTSVQTMGSFDQ